MAEPLTLITAEIYLKRLTALHPYLLSDLKYAYKLWMISIVLALKMNEDIIPDDKYLADWGLINLEGFKMLEAEYLEMIDYRLYVSTEEYSDALKRIARTHSLEPGFLNDGPELEYSLEPVPEEDP